MGQQLLQKNHQFKEEYVIIMTAHNSSRSQYTPITTESDASIEAGLSNLAALAKDTQTSDLDSSSSNTDA
ncbi:uncharacterized protein Bfra_008103 [Botrytis fragariae]|uniref:Uncharacterized protein n=1 Tax=Botrytis fragariae TaxID=1964551 RepID=A0A8H6APK2_9HELO|nr:uncharacterized protein Bfra_008103 [Botrytis fragariae]KAF5871583.1 hypothetical protein Bfra_008103 [Botrytis fragariae]